ncbi:hypothetical protein ABHF33_08670 [Chitinibacter sp. FCG-7]|uniref:Uncharacterized protein n=2 Tax=Chitinibacter mangrovi TaxID=3153927 RepID=A0AAU7F3N6_9NEIS
MIDRKGNENRIILAKSAERQTTAPAKRSAKRGKTSKNCAQWAETTKQNTQTEQNQIRKALSPLARAEFSE